MGAYYKHSFIHRFGAVLQPFENGVCGLRSEEDTMQIYMYWYNKLSIYAKFCAIRLDFSS